MGCSEWAALTPAQTLPFVYAWADKQKRERGKIEAVDSMLATIAYHTGLPYFGGAKLKPDDFKVFRPLAEPPADPEEIRATKDHAETRHARMMQRAAKINAAKRKAKHGKSSPKRTAVQRPR